MSVGVRYRPRDLMEAEYECFPDATHWQISSSNVLEIRQVSGVKTYRVVAHIHPDRWDRVQMLDSKVAH